MPIYRTADERFKELVDFPFAPRYFHWRRLRIHYVDEGEGDPVLCLHGVPTWAFVYRKVIHALRPNFRMLALDFIGFGRSDKYTAIADYSLELQSEMLLAFIEHLQLEGISLVVHDWGGLIGLYSLSRRPAKFARAVILNTFLPTGEEPASPAFLKWRAYVEQTSDLPIGFIMQRTLRAGKQTPAAVIRGYEAPFPEAAAKAATRAYPLLVPLNPGDPGAEEMRQARLALANWHKPALVLFAAGDPILGGAGRFFRRLLPGAAAQPERSIPAAGHFLQEDNGEAVAAEMARFLQAAG